MSRSPFRDRLAATAQPQASSPFFDRLPTEIRQKVYEELWDLHDTRWHVSSGAPPEGHAAPAFPCITGPDDEDSRYTNFQGSRGGDDVGLWESRLRSPWNTHWKCAEAAATKMARFQRRRVSPTTPIRFRPQLSAPLLVCKRMYVESIEALEDTFTFCFTDIIVARDFLARYSPTRNVRNIHISLRIKPLITELYFPGPDGDPPPRIGGIRVTSTNNPWEELCRRVVALPNLRELHIRLDSTDLRPWHKRVNEKKFFELLFRATARNYVLYLPELPGRPELQGLPGAYLEGDALDKAPFEVKRGPRPNNWQLHLSRISHVIPENWGHTLWNQVRDKLWAE